MFHRHLHIDKGTPVEAFPLAAIADILDRGDLRDWRPLRESVTADPWGDLADRILDICVAAPMYGTSVLWSRFVLAQRTRPTFNGQIRELRERSGKSQAEVAEAMGATQGFVSKLENKDRVTVDTLNRYAEANDLTVNISVR